MQFSPLLTDRDLLIAHGCPRTSIAGDDQTPRYRSAIERLPSSGGTRAAPLLTAHAARFRARLASDMDEAEDGFRSATKVFGELGLVFSLAVTQVEHAEWLLEHDRPEDAEPLLAEARETFERLGAAPSLERVAQSSARMRPAEPVL